MNYNWCFEYIKKDKIKCIFELGARDCLDSITLFKYFNCPIYAFECNPDCIIECVNNLNNNSECNIILIKKAVHEQDTTLQFRPFNKDKYDNIGASSLFEIDFISNRPPSDPDYGKKDVQNIIDVDAVRLDTFIRDNNIIPDLICMDIQEAELLALKGLGDDISKIKYIVFEASSNNTYKGGCTFFDVHEYLVSKNFGFLKSNNGSFPTKDMYFSFFDCIYINNEIIN